MKHQLGLGLSVEFVDGTLLLSQTLWDDEKNEETTFNMCVSPEQWAALHDYLRLPEELPRPDPQVYERRQRQQTGEPTMKIHKLAVIRNRPSERTKRYRRYTRCGIRVSKSAAQRRWHMVDCKNCLRTKRRP